MTKMTLRTPCSGQQTWRVAGLAVAIVAASLTGCSDPDSPNGGGSAGFSSAPEQCAPGNTFEPLRAPRATLETGIAGACALCSVMDAEAVIDEDPNSAATLNVPAAVAGTVFVSVFDTARVHPSGSKVGFSIGGEDDSIPLTIGLNQQITITTFLNGEEQESTSPDQGTVPIVLSVLDLPTLLTSPAVPSSRFFGVQVGKAFDEVRLDFGGTVQVLNSLRVSEVCVSDGS